MRKLKKMLDKLNNLWYNKYIKEREVVKMARYDYSVIDFKKDKNILITTVCKMDSNTGEVVNEIVYKKDLNNTDEALTVWHRVLKNGETSQKDSRMPANMGYTVPSNFSKTFLRDINLWFWSGKSFTFSNEYKKAFLLYTDLCMEYKTCKFVLDYERIIDTFDQLNAEETEYNSILMDIVNIRKKVIESNSNTLDNMGNSLGTVFTTEVRAYVKDKKTKKVCKELQITPDEFTQLQNDDYWSDLFYFNYLRGNPNGIILYLKMYNAYRNIMPCSYLLAITKNAIQRAKDRNIDYKVKGNPMDIIKRIADDYQASNGYNELLEKVNGLFKENQTGISLNYENEDFIVIVPVTYQELLSEGKALNNCLAHYEWNQYLKRGKRRVVFIREKSNPDRPYIACDINIVDNNIIQYYGYGNGTPFDEKAVSFKKEYQKYLDTLPLQKAVTFIQYYDSDIDKENSFNHFIF